MMNYQPISSPSTAALVLRQICFWLAISIIGGLFFIDYMTGMRWSADRFPLEAMLDGTAHRPFVYRVLVPFLANIIGLIVPTVTPQISIGLLIYASLIGFIWALRLLYTAFWPPPTTLRTELIFLLAPVALFPLTLNFRHIYDWPQLFLFTLGLALLAHRRWRAYLLIFGITCLNKETGVFLAPVFLAWQWRAWRTRTFWSVLVMQGLMYMLIRGVLIWSFRDNPGGIVEFHLFTHLAVYSRMPIYTLAHVLILILVGVLASVYAPRKPRQLVVAAGVLLGLIMPLFFLFGFPFEIRVFYEAFAPIYLICLPAWFFPPWSAEPAQPSSA